MVYWWEYKKKKFLGLIGELEENKGVCLFF